MSESIACQFTAAATSSGQEKVYTPEAGQTFELEKMRAYTFSATAGELSLTVNYGEWEVMPEEGRVYLTDEQLIIFGEAEYESGTPVVIDWENAEGSDYEVFVLLQGDLKG